MSGLKEGGYHSGLCAWLSPSVCSGGQSNESREQTRTKLMGENGHRLKKEQNPNGQISGFYTLELLIGMKL